MSAEEIINAVKDLKIEEVDGIETDYCNVINRTLMLSKEQANVLLRKFRSYIYREDVKHISVYEIFSVFNSLLNEKKLLDDYISFLRQEILSRHQKTGEIKIENDLFCSTMKKSPFGLEWLKDQYGIEKKDLPVSCFMDKTIEIINWEMVELWLKKQDISWDPKWTIQFKEKKPDVKHSHSMVTESSGDIKQD